METHNKNYMIISDLFSKNYCNLEKIQNHAKIEVYFSKSEDREITLKSRSLLLKSRELE